MKKILLFCVIATTLTSCLDKTSNEETSSIDTISTSTEELPKDDYWTAVDKELSGATYHAITKRVDMKYAKQVGTLSYFLTMYPNTSEKFTVEETGAYMHKMISLAEELGQYQDLDKEGYTDATSGKNVKYKELHVAVGAYHMQLWRNLSNNKLVYISIESVDGTGVEVSDGDGNGLLNPEGGSDIYRSPEFTGARSTWEFAKLPESQLVYANQQYIKVVRYMTAILEARRKDQV